MTAPTDLDLILRARRGDAEAYGELVTRYQTSVFNVCYRILHERGEAEDLAQESFMRAHMRLDTFDVEREFGSWIRRVAANLCLNHLESQRNTAELMDEQAAGDSQRPEAVVEVQRLVSLIRTTQRQHRKNAQLIWMASSGSILP